MKRMMLSIGIVIGLIGGIALLPKMLGAGSLEPTAPPGPTMKTLDEIPPTWSQKLQGSERFELVLDGEAVLDKETGLVWERNPMANPNGDQTYLWEKSCDYCFNLEVANRKGWRPPTIEELSSLIDNDNIYPALPVGHPFTLQNGPLPGQPRCYWSSTTHFSIIQKAWGMDISNGNAFYMEKNNPDLYLVEYLFVWCVRGGHGHNGTKSY